MRLASNYDRLHGAGAELIAISVDDAVRQAGMAKRWGLTHTLMVSDPGGETYLKSLGLFDPVDHDGIALPAMLVFDPDGNEIYRYQGRDFADRTNDDDLWTVLEGLDLPAVDPGPVSVDLDIPEDLKRFFRHEDFGAYFRGNMFGAIAIAGRLDDEAAKAIALQHRDMCKTTIDAWQTWSAQIT